MGTRQSPFTIINININCLSSLRGNLEAMADNEEIGLEERLKSALWLSIGKIVDEETIKLGVNATPPVYWCAHRDETVSQDLESFAKHAGRSTVNVSDVMLLARRNEGLESILKAFVEQQREETS
ncbi:hypothetical protein N7509_011335 [Penicillium cosmopolitanum]|uniref:Apoptosis-inducing TAF9-like domain 1 family protein n=1 Tax=Penicillium cosmopolitanum TaxID=1131564 RepID=A0A9W9VTA2_9EURO|nr:uncharacterized protein N7509_011335 [Penicillium cosmopolitanum]KAJ5388794.1 hypothetical protein N7509_011335 [Penicillium cosmopolitanum]